MSDHSLVQLSLFGNAETPFEAIKHIDQDGEYWLARELMGVLEYKLWQNFLKVIQKAKTSLDVSGLDSSKHVVIDVNKHVTKQGAVREVQDFKLQRPDAEQARRAGHDAA